MTASSLRRRYVVLSALRYFPTGLLIPVSAVFMLSRGLSLAQVGVAFATQSAVVLLLELPTGGLADSLGRRPVLVVATIIDLAAMTVFLTAHTLAAFMVAWALQGVYRALESGPLDAWYVDAALADDPGADIERGLAASNTSLSLAIAAGGLAAAGLASLPGTGGVEPLALPIVAALAWRAVDLVAIVALVYEVRAASETGTAWAGVRAAPQVVRTSVRLLATTPALLALVIIELLWGAGLVGVELLSGPRLVDLLGGDEKGVATFGIAVALAWLLCALGSAMTGRITRRLGSPPRAGAMLRVVQGASVLVMAMIAGPVGLVLGYLGFYIVHGPSNVVHYGMVHRLTTSETRATMISANSLTSRLGGMAAAVGLGALASGAGIPIAWVVCAVLLAAAAPLYRIAGRGRPVSLDLSARDLSVQAS